MGETILEMQHIAKAFSGVSALKDTQLTLRKGSVMALVGENGAGKSTLMRILTGIYNHDGGSILYKGQPVHFQNAMQARAAGIAIIHQEFNLFPNLTVAENIFLGDKSVQAHGFVNWNAMYRRAQELVDSIGGTFSVQEKVQALSVQNQQVVEIVKALAANAEVLIMDEPTSALPESEVQHLFRTIRGLKARGVAIVYVSHRLNEIFEICDDITVLRDGVTAFLSPVAATTQQEVVAQMIGKEVTVLYPKQTAEIGGPVLEVQHLSDGETVKDLSFCVHKGEILGLYGLVGSGATECPEALFGLVSSARGTFRMDGHPIHLNSPAQAVANHIAYVPPDRHRQGIIRQLSIRFNLTLAVVRRLCRRGFVRRQAEQALVDEYIEKLRIKCAGDAQKVTFLSGGNQQKVVIAKWLATKPSLLILNDPTRGVDVGAKAEIYALISELACAGMAIIITSSEISEILGMSDRILVLNEGVVSREFLRGQADQKSLLSAALVRADAPQGGL